MSLFTSTAAKALLAEVERIPEAAMAFARAEVSKIEAKFEDRFAALEKKAEADIGGDLDTKVKSALERLEGDGLDLSNLKTAIGGMTGGTTTEGDNADKGQPSDDAPSEAEAPSADAARDVDASTLSKTAGSGFADFSHAVDAAPATGADGTAKTDPAEAAKQAADAALAAGEDPVPAAAKAAHAAAAQNGDDAMKAATDAAAAAGAGPVEAARAAQNVASGA